MDRLAGTQAASEGQLGRFRCQRAGVLAQVSRETTAPTRSGVRSGPLYFLSSLIEQESDGLRAHHLETGPEVEPEAEAGPAAIGGDPEG